MINTIKKHNKKIIENHKVHSEYLNIIIVLVIY